MKNIIIYFLVFIAGGAAFLVAFHIFKSFGFIELLKNINTNYASALSALFGFAMLIVAIIMCVSLIQNKRTLDINTEVLKLQKDDFKIRNRPLVDVLEARFGSSVKSSEGDEYPHTIEIALENKTDIPASNFMAVCNIMLNDKIVKQTKIDIGSLTHGTRWQGEIFLTNQIYKEATQSSKKFAVEFSSTYSGMLGEKPDEYGTSFIINYFRENNDFRFANRVFR